MNNDTTRATGTPINDDREVASMFAALMQIPLVRP